MNELQTEVKNDYIILFFDNSSKVISENVANAIFTGNSEGFIKLEGQMINFKSISKLIPLNEYYLDNPDKRPVARKTFKAQEAHLYDKPRKIKALKSMIEGITRYIDGPQYQGKDNPIKLREKMEKRLKEIEELPDNKSAFNLLEFINN